MSRRIAEFLCMAKTCVLFGSNLIRLVLVQELSCLISACAIAWTVVTDLLLQLQKCRPRILQCHCAGL